MIIHWSMGSEISLSSPFPSSSAFHSVVVNEVDGKVVTHTDGVVFRSNRYGTVTEV
jgi:hypothetical protein